ncbi:8633_t:CDS:2 [Funneliformis mosseae]|uniref:8633_t:CDS:1 n=1 Tax=Funneliformis mosseae TaxID=27381 RepID=A0A9N9GV51_FUNMO|nr:8633_t:CDS:2 [Funneliformis mosseae]
MVSVLALTAICLPVDVEIIQSILERPNMKVIRTSIIHHPEITLEIKPKLIAKNKLYQIIFDLLDNLEGRTIIYEVTVIECNDIIKKLQKNFDPAIIGIYHENLQARRSEQQSRAILFYSQSDIRTLLTILSNRQESFTALQHSSNLNAIIDKKEKVMTMVLFAEIVYKCHQQLAYHFFLWPNNPMISECHNCDNCKE